MKTSLPNPRAFDPYDIWSKSWAMELRRSFYAGQLRGRVGARLLALVDWAAPRFLRRLLALKRSETPIAVAQALLCRHLLGGALGLQDLQRLRSLGVAAGQDRNSLAWGLGFGWVSKNGRYSSATPLVTHTPYVMEALLAFRAEPCRDQALRLFQGTWGFMESLSVMYEGDDGLALSYAPVPEPRIVVNANSYAALAYALHAAFGDARGRELATTKVLALCKWIAAQQGPDGEWWYYADQKKGNFIDCFHSCFVLKNLLKVREILRLSEDHLEQALRRGWDYLKREFWDEKSGLCRRFLHRELRDPYRWDLYDQAEYLGLLVDFQEWDAAEKLVERVRGRFARREDWFCRIDGLGRRWGRGFRRWGIIPFHLHEARLLRARRTRAISAPTTKEGRGPAGAPGRCAESLD